MILKVFLEYFWRDFDDNFNIIKDSFCIRTSITDLLSSDDYKSMLYLKVHKIDVSSNILHIYCC